MSLTMNVQNPHYISGVDKAGIASVRELLFFCFGVPSCSCCCGGCCRIVTSISGRAYSNGGEPGGGEAGLAAPPGDICDSSASTPSSFASAL